VRIHQARLLSRETVARFTMHALGATSGQLEEEMERQKELAAVEDTALKASEAQTAVTLATAAGDGAALPPALVAAASAAEPAE